MIARFLMNNKIDKIDNKLTKKWFLKIVYKFY